ncbi:MAG: ABC transporter permease [Clostridia bacterium]|nr:ABC transporter permease [Clostridia bacterium]
MTDWKRATLYLTRMKKRNVLLSIVFLAVFIFLVCVFILISMLTSVRSAVESSLKCYITAEARSIDKNMIDFVQNYESIEEYALYSSVDMSIVPKKAVPGINQDEVSKDIVRFICGDSKEYFAAQEGELVLLRGDYSDSLSGKECIISADLAAMNDIEIGDEILVSKQMDQYTIDNENSFSLRVIGIYGIKTASEEKIPSFEMQENMVFSGSAFADEVCSFYQIENVTTNLVIRPETRQSVQDIKHELQSQNTNAEIQVHDLGYRMIQSSVFRIVHIIQIVFVLIAALLIIIVFLLNHLWMTKRKKEFGLFKAFGVWPQNILAQLCFEEACVVLPALIIAILMSLPLSQIIRMSLQKMIDSVLQTDIAMIQTVPVLQIAGMLMVVASALILSVSLLSFHVIRKLTPRVLLFELAD